jgi:hypothetical protein
MADIVKYFANMSDKFNGGKDVLCAVKLAAVRYFQDNAYYFDVESSIDRICACFTLDNIVSQWAGRPVRLYVEEDYSLTAQERGFLDAVLAEEKIDLHQVNSEMIGRIYESTLKENEKKKAGIVYTPEDIVEYMTDMIRQNIKPDSKLIDPACGCGMFLSGFYDALMNHYCYEKDSASIRQTHIRILGEIYTDSMFQKRPAPSRN